MTIGAFNLLSAECNRKAGKTPVCLKMPRTFAAPLISLLAALLTLNACSTVKPHSARTARYVVSASKASFYKYGPAQSFGPDLQLPRGQKLTKLDHSFGFSHVMTDDGTTGYVANEDIKPAPPEPVAAVSSAPKSKKPHRNNSVEPSLKTGGFDMNDVPLPSADSAPGPSDLRLR
jgi:hypothetical protein